MTRYILGRIFQALFSMIALSVLIFLLARITGDPALILLPDDAPLEQRQKLRAELHLDQPLYVQYGIWIWDVVRGDLGSSTSRHTKVSDLLSQRIPNTLQLAAAGFFVTMFIGVPVGIYAAARRGSSFDLIARFIAVFGQAVPGFWLGIILILVFGVWLRVLPVGSGKGFLSLILPAFTIGWVSTAGIMRVTRSSMLEVLDSEYVKLARIKGVSEGLVLWKHALKNVGLPLLTYAGLILFTFVSGTIVTETVFAWPGVGSLVYQAVLQRDFPVLQGAVLFISAVYLFGNLLIDLAYAFLNPRIRYGGEG